MCASYENDGFFLFLFIVSLARDHILSFIEKEGTENEGGEGEGKKLNGGEERARRRANRRN